MFKLFKKKPNKKNIIIFGHGRSGTTWLAQIISASGIELNFEPLNYSRLGIIPKISKPYNTLYLQKGDKINMEKFYDKALKGKIRTKWTQRGNSVKAKRKVIKVIRANLMIDWVLDRYDVYPIFMIRNPFAVVVSRTIRKKGENNVNGLFENKILYDLYLHKFRKYKKLTDPMLVGTFQWCLQNYIPKVEGILDKVQIIQYEKLYENPNKVIKELAEKYEFDFNEDVKKMINSKSVTARKYSKVEGYDPLTNWKKHVTEEQIKKMLEIIEDFDLMEYVSI